MDEMIEKIQQKKKEMQDILDRIKSKNVDLKHFVNKHRGWENSISGSRSTKKMRFGNSFAAFSCGAS